MIITVLPLLIVATVRSRLIVVLTLAPPSRFLVPRNHPSFMPPRRTQRSSNPSVRRRELALELTEVAMRPCSLCKLSGKQCLVGGGSNRCSNCVDSGRKCDLVVSPAEMRRVEADRKKVWLQLKSTQEDLMCSMEESMRLQSKLRRLQT